MLVRFEDRSGDIEEVEMEIDEPCPVCCGMLFPMDGVNPESGYRCSSCGVTFEVTSEDGS